MRNGKTSSMNTERIKLLEGLAFQWSISKETTDQLIQFFHTIQCKDNYNQSDCKDACSLDAGPGPGQAVQVISHSMRCRIALAACNTSPSLFHSNLFVGGMFAGGVGLYPMNTEGMAVGLNREYLGPGVVQTCPSMYASASPMGVGRDPILRNEFRTQFVDAVDGDGDGQNMHNFINMNMSSSKSGDVVPSNSNTPVQTQRSVDIDMYDVND